MTGVIRCSAWADDEGTVSTDVVWCTEDGRKYSARVNFTAEQALDYAEKLRSAAQSIARMEQKA
jgi:hypothetical protein